MRFDDRVWQIFPATSYGAFRLQRGTFIMRVDGGSGDSPGRYCSPRHRMLFDSRHEGSKRVPMTWRAIRA